MRKRKGKARHDGSDKYRESRIPADVSKQAPNNSCASPLFYEDTPFKCVDCGKEEVWTALQQKWHYEVAKGSIYGRATRCRACRNLPSQKDINVYDSLDEQHACRVFFGKDLADVEILFAEGSMPLWEDLMWMGPKAFRFYVVAAVNYAKSDFSAGDSEFLLPALSTLEFRLQDEREELLPVAPLLESLCSYILEHWEKFQDPDLSNDSDGQRKQLCALQQSFQQLRLELPP